MNFWKGSECQRGEELEYRSSKCYDCCDGVLAAKCNQNFLAAYKAAASVESIDSAEFLASWREKNGKY